MLIKNLPNNIMKIAIERARQDGNEDEPEDYIKNLPLGGAFMWADTIEGGKIWREVDHGSFDCFYEFYNISISFVEIALRNKLKNIYGS